MGSSDSIYNSLLKALEHCDDGCWLVFQAPDVYLKRSRRKRKGRPYQILPPTLTGSLHVAELTEKFNML